MPPPIDPLDDKLPTDPDALRAYVKRVRSLFRLWAASKGTTPEEGFKRASAIMRELRAMLGEPTAEDEIEASRALEAASGQQG